MKLHVVAVSLSSTIQVPFQLLLYVHAYDTYNHIRHSGVVGDMTYNHVVGDTIDDAMIVDQPIVDVSKKKKTLHDDVVLVRMVLVVFFL